MTSTSVYTKNLQITAAQQFKRSVESISEPYYYLGFGKVTSWEDDNDPPFAESSVENFIDVWKNLIGVKVIQGSDARLGIRRFDWEQDTSFSEYDDCSCSSDMNDANNKFYVVTDEWNVYKCLSNNNGGLSTSKPTSILTNSAVQLSDKYIWKYMYTLTDEEIIRFTTDKFIPVKTLTENNGSLQWLVQNNAVQGSIESIKIIDAGENYDITPVITIVGDGVGANAYATINTASSNSIESIVISNKGSSYTYANVIISGVGTGANARVVLSPPGGHGSNPEEELGGSFVILNPRIQGSEEGVLDIINEFRQISILKNIKLRANGTLATARALSQTTTVYLTEGTTEYLKDEVVYQGASLEESSFRGKVVSWDSDLNILELIDISGNLTTDPITGDTSRSSRYVESVVERDLQPYSGSLLYMNNISPIQRSTDQTEDFKIVISF